MGNKARQYGAMSDQKALVVFSGGQDSTTCLAQAIDEFPAGVETVIFDYGQRHRVELAQAQKIANIANVPFQIIDLMLMSQLTRNALTCNEVDITETEGGLPSTFVPGRNHMFLSVAAIIANQKGIKTLYTGVCQTDYSGYPDCREDFIKSLEKTVNLAMDDTIEIRTPLMFMTKAESVLHMKKLGKLEWLEHSHTCYEGKRPACGVCPACKLRLRGFYEAGIDDPLEYEG